MIYKNHQLSQWDIAQCNSRFDPHSAVRWPATYQSPRTMRRDSMTNLKGFSRRGVLKGGLAGIVGTGIAPMFFTKGAYAQEFCNAPTGDTVTIGFNMPLTGAYADEGADEQRAYELAVEHLNGGGDGGLI